MATDKIRKYVLPNIPYLFIGWFCLKIGTAYRLAAGTGFGEKLLGLGQTIGAAFADFAPGLNARFHFLADVLCIPLRHDIDKGRKLQCVGLLAVNAVVDRDKAHIVPSEYFHRVADLEIVAPPAGEVFHNADTDFPVFHIVHHAGVGGTVKKSAAFVIVDVVPDIG
jgi:hypothetical protein